MKILDRTIQMVDATGQVIAHILIFRDEDGNKWAQCYPFMAMYEMMKVSMANPIILMDGMQMPMPTLLGYIANVARFTENASNGWYYELRTIDTPQYARVVIKAGMSAKELANVTGYNVEFVVEFYKDYFVVYTGEANEKESGKGT